MLRISLIVTAISVIAFAHVAAAEAHPNGIRWMDLLRNVGAEAPDTPPTPSMGVGGSLSLRLKINEM